MAGRYVAATGALIACGHCGGLRRVRMEGELVSCDSCGKVLQQRGRKQRALEVEAWRRRRWLGARKRRDGRAAAGGGGMVVGREASDAESDTGCVCFVESSS